MIKSDSGGYTPEDNVTSGLSLGEEVPAIGEYWNGDATVQAAKFVGGIV